MTVANARKWYPLKEVPGQFLNKQNVQFLVEHYGSHEDALECLASPVGLWGRPDDFDQMFDRAEELRSELQTAIRLGRLIVRAFHPGNVTGHAPIHPHFSDEMRFDFLKNEIKIGPATYTNVEISQAYKEKSPNPSQLVKWLEANHDLRGGKEALRHKAHTEFGGDVTQRDFNTAYKTAFDKPRGRPKK